MLFTKDLIHNGTVVKLRDGSILYYCDSSDTFIDIDDSVDGKVIPLLAYKDNLLHIDRPAFDIVAINDDNSLSINVANAEDGVWHYVRMGKEDYLLGEGYTLQLTGSYKYNDWDDEGLIDLYISFDNLSGNRVGIVTKKTSYTSREEIDLLYEAFEKVESDYNTAIAYEMNSDN